MLTSRLTHGKQMRKSHLVPFTPRPSPLSQQVNPVDGGSIKLAVDGLVQDYPMLPKLAMKLSALGREHSRKKADLVAEAVEGVPTPDKARYLNHDLVNALYNSASLRTLPPTPLLAAFRTPLLARYHDKAKSGSATDDDSIEISRHGQGLASETPRDGDLDFGFDGTGDIGLEDEQWPDEQPQADDIMPSPPSPPSSRKRLRSTETVQDQDENREDRSGKEDDLSHTYAPEVGSESEEEVVSETRKGIKKRKVNVGHSTPAAITTKTPRHTQPSRITKSTPAQISAGKARSQKSKDIKNDCCQIFEEYTASTLEAFDELLESDTLEVEDYKVAIRNLKQDALEAQEAVAELRSTRYTRGNRSTPKSDRLLRRGMYDVGGSQHDTPSRSGGQSSRG